MRPLACLVADRPERVAELIDPSSARWMEDKIRTVFLPFDPNTILKRPLCTKRVDDFWAWGEDDKGVFSVRSVYKFLLKSKLQGEALLQPAGGHSNEAAEESDWTSLWHIKVPSKIKVFSWRLCHETIPTAGVLHHRNMATTSVCTFCSAQDDWKHALIDCVMARSVWPLCSEEAVEIMLDNLSFDAKNYVFTMHDSLSHEEFTRMVVTLWAVWQATRRDIHEEIFDSPFSTNSFINHYLRDLELLEKGERGAQKRASIKPTVWIAPPDGHAKMNVDAAVSMDGDCGAAGVVCRDYNGRFLGASALKIEFITDANAGRYCCEGRASLSGGSIRNKIQIASDYKRVVDVHKNSASEYGAIVHEIIHHANSFMSCKVVHEFRRSNFETTTSLSMLCPCILAVK